MFSDKYRILTIVILAALILAGCFYAAYGGPKADPFVGEILEDPTNIGQDVVVRYAKINEVADQEWRLETMDYEFIARSEVAVEAKPNLDVSFYGIMTDVGEVEVTEFHTHLGRAFKYYFSLPAIVFIIYLLFRKYRFSWRRVTFYEKKRNPR
ncbi:hypothetical protein ACFL0Z_01185 [Patescibacteria group bacterium]